MSAQGNALGIKQYRIRPVRAKEFLSGNFIKSSALTGRGHSWLMHPGRCPGLTACMPFRQLFYMTAIKKHFFFSLRSACTNLAKPKLWLRLGIGRKKTFFLLTALGLH